MWLKKIPTFALLLEVVLANVQINDDGWLDRLLEQHKDKLKKRVQPNPIDLQAIVIPKPPDFQDPKDWSFDSVLLLIKLLKESKSAEPVLQILRRAMTNSGAKFRGYDADLFNTVIRIKEHIQAQLPHSEIRVMNVVDILKPQNPADPPEYHPEYFTPNIPPVSMSIFNKEGKLQKASKIGRQRRDIAYLDGLESIGNSSNRSGSPLTLPLELPVVNKSQPFNKL